jgi:hypothetical protein
MCEEAFVVFLVLLVREIQYFAFDQARQSQYVYILHWLRCLAQAEIIFRFLCNDSLRSIDLAVDTPFVCACTLKVVRIPMDKVIGIDVVLNWSWWLTTYLQRMDWLFHL